ncbi:MAG: hypothetical protein EXQ56_00895 [Acidobacteria bacterium]|nr:hypothetical protein [Acidobacteriota bacterium]
MNLELSTGGPDGPTEALREEYRKATLTLEGLVYIVIDPPFPDYDFAKAGALWITGGEHKSTDKVQPPIPLEEIPHDAFTYRFYVENWNSCIHIVAKQARIQVE